MSRGRRTAPCVGPDWPVMELLVARGCCGGNAMRGIPRSTAAIPIALPMCDAMWSVVSDAWGSAESVRYSIVEYVFSA